MRDAWAKLQKCKRPIEFREGPPSLERPMSEYVVNDQRVLLKERRRH